MRLFVAVVLTDDLKKKMTGMLHEMKKQGIRGSYVPVQNLHLTVAFIGETASAEPVRAALQNVRFKPFRLSLSELGCFGDLLWAGVKGNQGLSAAVKSVRSALDDAGIAYDRKKFAPHITLIRKVSGNWKQLPAPKGDMEVKKISLMKSEIRDGRRVYTEIASF